MAQKPSKNMEDTRLRASAPHVSAWVSANAGAGKTHLLVARVLRLLLADVAPSRILCVTYTRAAAAEMQGRILGTLSKWVRLSDGELSDALEEMCGAPQPEQILKRARSLFAKLADAPEALRIDTLHALCQSLLKRFPLEAGVAPYFSVIDERTTGELLHEAAMQLVSASLSGPDASLGAAVQALAARMNELSFHALLQDIAGDRRRLLEMFSGGVPVALARVYALLGVLPQDTEETLFEAAFRYTEDELVLLRACARKLLASPKKTDTETGAMLDAWLAEPEKKVERRGQYVAFYHTQGGEKRARLFTKDILNDEEQAALLAEQERAHAFEQRCRSLRTAVLSAHLITIAAALLEAYEALKRQRAVKDYDDLVKDAAHLLSQPGIAPWVRYKLDEGIDHVLIDEAQDTSVEQWAIARALTEEFFAGEGRSEAVRTVFAVGDTKQSIFRFQGARPELFGTERDYYAARVTEGAWLDAGLPESFRSVRAVLEAVDAVFSQPQANLGLSGEAVRHLLTRKDEGGLVEVWPLIPVETEEKHWQMPTRYVRQKSPSQQLAVLIADTIHGWLHHKETLAAKGRPIRPGDIMILVRRRNELAEALLHALRRRGVPVAGADRLVLSDSLVVKDLLALGQFLLLPEDDLSLAGVLKTPLFAFSEEELFTLAHGREESCSLWERLHDLRREQPFKHAHATLSALLAKADFCPPYELYAHVLDASGGRAHFVARMGSTVHDLLDEFLAQALAYESAHTPSLQGFLHWMAVGDVQIRRDMEQGRDEVRIMTVHAAKGLQAPVVILPDTAALQKPNNSHLLWHEEGGCLLWSPPNTEAPQEAAEAKQARDAEEQREYRRLLYVAMTRAEDRLYVCGLALRKAGVGQSWHQLVTDGLKGAAGVTEAETSAGRGFRLECAQEKAVKQEAAIATSAVPPMPRALTEPAPLEPPSAQPLSPSRLWQDEAGSPALSPAMQEKLYQRGNVLHRLLQYVPQLPAPARRPAAETLLARYGVEEGDRAALLREALAIPERPEFAAFFAPGSLAEVPLSGMVEINGARFPVAGQVDRLAVTQDEVWVLDYKTHAAPPAGLSAVPQRYLRQMAAYRALLLAIYPARRVRCALLWTAGPTLMELPESQLSRLCQPLTELSGVPRLATQT